MLYEVTIEETCTKTITTVYTVEANSEMDAEEKAKHHIFEDFEVVDSGDPEYSNPVVVETNLIDGYYD